MGKGLEEGEGKVRRRNGECGVKYNLSFKGEKREVGSLNASHQSQCPHEA